MVIAMHLWQGWLALKVPARLPKLAECNAPIGAVRSYVEVYMSLQRQLMLFQWAHKTIHLQILPQCHVVKSEVDMDAAQRAMQEYRQVGFQKGLVRPKDCADFP